MHLPQDLGRVENRPFSGATHEVVHKDRGSATCKTVAWAANRAAAEAAADALYFALRPTERRVVVYYTQALGI